MESTVPSLERTNNRLLTQLVDSMDLLVEPPRLITANGLALADSPGCVIRLLQNVGTTTVFGAIGLANPSIDAYHFVLAAGVAADDGTGGSIDLSRVRGDVYIADPGGSPRVATIQAKRKL